MLIVRTAGSAAAVRDPEKHAIAARTDAAAARQGAVISFLRLPQKGGRLKKRDSTAISRTPPVACVDGGGLNVLAMAVRREDCALKAQRPNDRTAGLCCGGVLRRRVAVGRGGA